MGEKAGPNPTDRRKRGSKHHVLTDAQGIPLAALVTGAHRHDVTQLLPLLEAIPPVRGSVGAPAVGRAGSRGTGGMIRSLTGGSCERWGSPPCWPNAGQPTAVAWASIAGSWNGPWHGCRNGAGCGYAMRGVQTFMKPFSRWDVR